MIERRVVRTTIQLSEEHQTIAAGRIVLAKAVRDYADDLMARRLELWIETEVTMPAGTPAATAEVVLVGTDTPLEYDAGWLASVDDGEWAWHIYQLSPSVWTDGDRRRICGATPGREPVWMFDDPAEAQYWRVRCQQDPGHDATNHHTPHQANNLGSTGTGSYTWYDEERP